MVRAPARAATSQVEGYVLKCVAMILRIAGRGFPRTSIRSSRSMCNISSPAKVAAKAAAPAAHEQM